jgi:hypothetical protein
VSFTDLVAGGVLAVVAVCVILFAVIVAGRG